MLEDAMTSARHGAPIHGQELDLWVQNQLDPQEAGYHVAMAFRVTGPLSRLALAQALDATVAAHPALRARYSDGEAGPRRHVEPATRLGWEDLGDGQPERVRRFASAPFDLESGPPLRVGGSRETPEGHVVAVCLHHICCDAAAIKTMLREWSARYAAIAGAAPAGMAPPVGELRENGRTRLTHASSRTRVEGPRASSGLGLDERRHEALRYWRGQLADPPPALLPAPSALAPLAGRPALVEAVTLSGSDVWWTRAHSRQQGVTTHSLALAAYALTLSRRFDREELLVGVPVSLRGPRDARVVNCQVTVLPVRVRVGGDRLDGSLLRHVHQRSLGALAHRHVAATDLRRLAGVRLGESLWQAAMGLRGGPEPTLALPGCRVTRLPVELGRAQHPLDLDALLDQDVLTLTLRADAGLVSEGEARAVVESMAALLPAAPAGPPAVATRTGGPR